MTKHLSGFGGVRFPTQSLFQPETKGIKDNDCYTLAGCLCWATLGYATTDNQGWHCRTCDICSQHTTE